MPEYTWEAVSVDAGPNGDWPKTLFHITGNTNYPDFVPRRQPVLIVNGGTTNANTFFNSFKAAELAGQTRMSFAGAWEANLLQMIKDEDPNVLTCLTELKAAQEKKRWAELSKYWKEENIVDLEQLLTYLTDEAAKAAEEEADAASGTEATEQTQAEKDEATCASQQLSDSLAEYIMAVENEGWRSSEPMPLPTKPLPVSLFDYGYDVWVDGNRGTTYQDGGKDRTLADTWTWDFRDMALEDQVAQIDFITSVSKDYDFLSYIGYSLGTRQMYWLMDEANREDGSQAAKDALAKVDKFLSMTVCPYGTKDAADIDAAREAALTTI
jgi:hypothetical protein